MNSLPQNVFWSQPNTTGQVPVPELSPNSANQQGQQMYYMMQQQNPFLPQMLQHGVPITHQGPGPPIFQNAANISHQQLLNLQQQQQLCQQIMIQQQQQKNQQQQVNATQILPQQYQWQFGQPSVKVEPVSSISPNNSAIVFDNGTQYIIDATNAFNAYQNWSAPNFFQYSTGTNEIPKVTAKEQLSSFTTIQPETNIRIDNTITKPHVVENTVTQTNTNVNKDPSIKGVHIKEEIKVIPATVHIATQPNCNQFEQLGDGSIANSPQIAEPEEEEETDTISNTNETEEQENEDVEENIQGNVNKPFVCTFCKFAASSKFSLGRHIRGVHERKKDFKCPSCEYAAAQKGTLDGHINAVHHKIKPFQCSQCDHATSHKFRLDNHIKSKHSFKCSMCNFVDLRKENLETHIKTFHQFKCEKCDFVSSQKGYLDEHTKTQHNMLTDGDDDGSSIKTGINIKNNVQNFILHNDTNNQKDKIKLVSLPIIHSLNNTISSPSISSIQTVNKSNSDETETIITVCDLPSSNDSLLIPSGNLSIINSNKHIETIVDDQRKANIISPKITTTLAPSVTLNAVSTISSVSTTPSPQLQTTNVVMSRPLSRPIVIENIFSTAGRHSPAVVPSISPNLITDSINWSNEANQDTDLVDNEDQALIDQVPTSTTEGGKRKRYKCEKCEFSTRQSYSLRRHVRFVHDKIRPFKCIQCSFAAAQKSDLDKHIIVIHENGKYLKCHLCPYNAKRKQLLDEHIINIHGLITERTNSESVEDPPTQNFGLIQHNIISSENEITTTTIPPNAVSPSPSLEYEDPQSLGTVQFVSFDNGNIMENQNQGKIIQFKCEKCDYTTKQKYLLQRHVKFVHDKIRPFKCTKCEMSFGQKAHLSSHNRSIHDKLRPFNCEFCPHSASEKGNLDKHIRAVHGHSKGDPMEEVVENKPPDEGSRWDIVASSTTTNNVIEGKLCLKQEINNGYDPSLANSDLDYNSFSLQRPINDVTGSSSTCSDVISNSPDNTNLLPPNSATTSTIVNNNVRYDLSHENDTQDAPTDESIQNLILNLEQNHPTQQRIVIEGQDGADARANIYAELTNNEISAGQNNQSTWKIKTEFNLQQNNPYLGMLQELPDIKPNIISNLDYLYNPATSSIQCQSYDFTGISETDLNTAIASILPVEQSNTISNNDYISNDINILSQNIFTDENESLTYGSNFMMPP